MKSIHSSVQSAVQTTYVFHDRPEKIRVIHPPHPLFGQTLEVIRPRREAEGTYWIARLKDGSRISLPSSWTDHPVDKRPVQRIRAGGHATPSALRDLADLLEVIVLGSPLFHNRSRDSYKGGHDERTTVSLRMEGTELGSKDMGAARSPSPAAGSLTARRDGKGCCQEQARGRQKGGGG